MMRCCKHCGALLEDDATVCNFCGAALEVPKFEPAPEKVAVVEAPVHEATPETAQAAPRKKLSKKAWLFGIGGIALAAIIIAVAVNMLFFNPDSAVKNLEAVQNGKVDHLEALVPKELWETVARKQNISVNEHIAIRSEALKKSYLSNISEENGYYGKLLSYEMDVLDREKVSAADVAGIKKALEKTYNIDADRVGTAYKLFVKVTRKGTKDIYHSAQIITAVKIDSTWYLISYSKYNDTYEVTFTAGSLIGYHTYSFD